MKTNWSKAIANDKEDPLISREEIIKQLGSFALLSATTMMVLLPSKAHAETSPPTSDAPSAPKVPQKHGL